MERALYLLDAMSLVFRAYYAMMRSGRQLQSPSGEPTGAIFGYTSMITALVERYTPDYIACVFDTREPTHRHDAYADYKAHRQPFPEDLVPQLERIKQITDALGIPRVELPGYEADDIIGTLADRAAQDGFMVYCVTSDKDFYQLTSDRIVLLKPNGGGAEYQVHGVQQCRERFGVEPYQVVDVLALMGDASDNIPGVRGIGEKPPSSLSLYMDRSMRSMKSSTRSRARHCGTNSLKAVQMRSSHEHLQRSIAMLTFLLPLISVNDSPPTSLPSLHFLMSWDFGHLPPSGGESLVLNPQNWQQANLYNLLRLRIPTTSIRPLILSKHLTLSVNKSAVRHTSSYLI